MRWRAFTHKVVLAVEAVQVEFHGQYSPERLMLLADYCETVPTKRVPTVLMTVPIPCLLAIVLLELPSLQSPDIGAPGNVTFWGRVTIIGCISSLTIFVQFHHVLHLPPIQWTNTLAAITLVGLGTGISSFGLSLLIGFPLPFYAIISAQPWTAFFVAALAVLWRQYYRLDQTLWPQTVAHTKVLMVQSAMTFIYPIYYHLFRRLSPIHQSLFSLLLPLIKIALKNLMSYQFRNNADLRPEEIIFSIEIFSALFVTFCMQQSASLLPVLMLTALDFLHACILLNDIAKMSRDIQILQQEMLASTTVVPASDVVPFQSDISLSSPPSGPQTKDTTSTIDHITRILERMGSKRLKSESNRPSTWRKRIWPSALRFQETTSSDLPTKEDVNRSSASARALPPINLLHLPETPAQKKRRGSAASKEDRYVKQVLRLLHATEYIVLVEFTEVVIPLVYSIYVCVIMQLPNRAYYDYLRDMDAANLQRVAVNVFVYSMLELASLILLDAVVRWRLRFSLLTQLAFVIENQRATIVSKLVLWIVYIIQGSLQHYGNDYTFQFTWHRGKH